MSKQAGHDCVSRGMGAACRGPSDTHQTFPTQSRALIHAGRAPRTRWQWHWPGQFCRSQAARATALPGAAPRPAMHTPAKKGPAMFAPVTGAPATQTPVNRRKGGQAPKHEARQQPPMPGIHVFLLIVYVSTSVCYAHIGGGLRCRSVGGQRWGPISGARLLAR